MLTTSHVVSVLDYCFSAKCDGCVGVGETEETRYGRDSETQCYRVLRCLICEVVLTVVNSFLSSSYPFKDFFLNHEERHTSHPQVSVERNILQDFKRLLRRTRWQTTKSFSAVQKT